jgi:hypothetical protein
MSARLRVRLLVTTAIALLWTLTSAAVVLAGDGAGPLPR